MGRPWYESGLKEEDPDVDNIFELRRERRERALQRRRQRMIAMDKEAEETAAEEKRKKLERISQRRNAPWSFTRVFQVDFPEINLKQPSNSKNQDSKVIDAKVKKKQSPRKAKAKKEVHPVQPIETRPPSSQKPNSKPLPKDSHAPSSIPLKDRRLEEKRSSALRQSFSTEATPSATASLPVSVERSHSHSRKLSRSHSHLETPSDLDLTVERSRSEGRALPPPPRGNTALLRRLKSSMSLSSGFDVALREERAPPSRFIPAYYDYQRRVALKQRQKPKRYKWALVFYGVYKKRTSEELDIDLDVQSELRSCAA